MRRLTDGGLRGERAGWGTDARIALIAAYHRVDRVEHGDVDNRHRARGAAGTKLFSEHPILSGRDRRVVKATGIDRDFVPTANGVQAVGRPMSGTGVEVWRSLVQRAVSLVVAVRGRIRES